MAAPMVAGEAALVAQLHPDWTGVQIADCIRSATTSAVAARNDITPALPIWKGHQFDYQGSIPIIDAAKAVHCGEVGPPPVLRPQTISAGYVPLVRIGRQREGMVLG